MVASLAHGKTIGVNESAECHLLGGFFASFVQACLGVLCIGALIIKRHNEVPKRDWYVWFLDVTKQGMGASFGHFANIFLSVIIASILEHADECQWYSLTFVVDSTLGTLMNLSILRLFKACMGRFPQCTIMNMGDYGDPPQLWIYIPQLLVWLLIVSIVKIITILAMVPCLQQLNSFVSYLFGIFDGQPELELVVVMIIIPTVLNTVQFWITDTFLMNNVEQHERPTHGRIVRMLSQVRAAASGSAMSRYNHHEPVSSVDPDEGMQMQSSLDAMERNSTGQKPFPGTADSLAGDVVYSQAISAEYQARDDRNTPLLGGTSAGQEAVATKRNQDINVDPGLRTAEIEYMASSGTRSSSSATIAFNQLLMRTGLAYWWSKSTSGGGMHPRTNSETDLLEHEQQTAAVSASGHSTAMSPGRSGVRSLISTNGSFHRKVGQRPWGTSAAGSDTALGIEATDNELSQSKPNVSSMLLQRKVSSSSSDAVNDAADESVL